MRDRIEDLKLLLARGSAFGPRDNRVSERLCEIFGGNGVQLLHLEASGELRYQWTSGYEDVKLEDEYSRHYHEINPKVAAADFTLPVMTDAMVLDLDTFRRTEFFSWYAGACGLCDNLAFHVPEPDGSIWALSVGRAARHGICDDEEIAAARELHPYLVNNISLSGLITGSAPFIEAILAQKTQHDSVWLLCDVDARVIIASDRADSGKLKIRGDGSWAVDAGGRHFDGAGFIASVHGSRSFYRRLPGGDILSVSLIAIETLFSRRRVYLVCIIESVWPVDFTTSEREVAALLLKGLDLRQISLRRGTSYHTVRNQTVAMREKTGTSSLTALVACLSLAASIQ